jgi:hypothetical protein
MPSFAPGLETKAASAGILAEKEPDKVEKGSPTVTTAVALCTDPAELLTTT